MRSLVYALAAMGPVHVCVGLRVEALVGVVAGEREAAQRHHV